MLKSSLKCVVKDKLNNIEKRITDTVNMMKSVKKKIAEKSTIFTSVNAKILSHTYPIITNDANVSSEKPN